MHLLRYLEQFNNICWYPSADMDFMPMVCLSHKILQEHGMTREVPDCFIFTDYDPHLDSDTISPFFTEFPESQCGVRINYEEDNYSATAFNIKEIERIRIPFNKDLVAGDCDENYGRVFTADILIERPYIGKTVTKLVYVITENTSFAFNYLIKRHIKVRYAIHSRYGHGFGGGLSNGVYMTNILNELGIKYFVSDINNRDNLDIADIYLTEDQKRMIPILKFLDNYSIRFNWHGYDDVIFYKVVGYETVNVVENHNQRFILTKNTR